MFAVVGGRLSAQWRGQVAALDGAAQFECRDAAGKIAPDGLHRFGRALTHEAALAHSLQWLQNHAAGAQLVAAGHRIVHGGGLFARPVLLGQIERAALQRLVPLAPLHQPHNLAGVDAVARLLPRLPQIGCFDTAFHATIPDVASTLALPQTLRAQGLRRYGFHGLSYEHVAAAIRTRLPRSKRARVIAAHLGNGASLCALKDGKSIDTTMGFSTLDGLVMGTRPGSIDSGALLYLLRQKKLDAAALEDLLYRGSGLIGLSGLSADMRALEASPDPRARFAIDVFVYRLVQHIGAMAATLGGLDALIFTGGIGEKSALVRGRVCAALGWLGVKLDAAANGAHAPRISAARAKVTVLIVPADEEGVIARQMLALLRG